MARSVKKWADKVKPYRWLTGTVGQLNNLEESIMAFEIIADIEGVLHPWLGDHIDWKQLVLTGLTPVFLVFIVIEWQIRRRKGKGHRMWQQFETKDILTNLALGGAYQVFEVIAHLLVTGVAVLFLYQHRFYDIPVNGWTILPIFIAVEFCYYWFHRTSHRVRWFWSAHVVHHSSERMNFTTAMRQSLLYSITGWWLFFMPLVLLGVHPAVVFFLYGCDLAYQFFIHTEAVGKFHRWVEYWFDTPSNHRVHHGRNPEYVDKNYGGVLICFDRWFGTYAEEHVDNSVDYGITRQIHSYNILTLNFHEFADMWRDVFRSGSLGQRIKHIWAPPEWVRDDATGDQLGLSDQLS
jgi:sterol desaturase/sphingolipid hydroxylase (fatty acid hydroxylase superfamily)